MTTHWHVSRNIVGYLPESEDGSFAFSDWGSARDSLADDIDRWGDSILDVLNADDEGFDTLARQYDDAVKEVRSMPGPDVGIDIFLPSSDSTHALDVHFWLAECSETDCETEE